MKKSYSSPLVMIEQFTPNEYVAACGDVNYKFTCNMGTSFWDNLDMIWYYPDKSEDNVLDGEYNGKKYIFRNLPTDISPCKATADHITDSTDNIYEGVVTSARKPHMQNVLLWLEKDKSGRIINAHLSNGLLKEVASRS